MHFGSILFCSRCHWRRWGEVGRGSKQGKSWELKVPTGPLCMMAMAHSGRLRKAIASLDDIHEWLYEMMIWWLEFGQRNFHQKLQDNHHDQAGERESPFDESRRQGRLFWRGFQLQKSSEISGAMECSAGNCSASELLFCNSPIKATFSPGNPLRCVLLRKRLCSRHQRLFPIEYHDTGRLLCLFDLQHEKWERKSLWRSTLGRMCPHRVA